MQWVWRGKRGKKGGRMGGLDWSVVNVRNKDLRAEHIAGS